MTQPILLLSGPNLNLLGDREPEVYGTATLDDHVAVARAAAEAAGFELEHLQSNHEGELVEAIHGARRRCSAIIINPGAFTHYAWAIHDALAEGGTRRHEFHFRPSDGRGAIEIGLSASHLETPGGRAPAGLV